MQLPDRPRSAVIENVYPELDCGLYPVKREVGATFDVWADILLEGHDKLAAVLKYRRRDESAWRETPMRLVDNDRWHGQFVLEANTRYVYTIEAWRDAFASWRADTRKKVDAGQDVASDLLEGQRLVLQAAERASGRDAQRLRELAAAIGARDQAAAAELALSDEVAALVDRYPDRSASTTYCHNLEVVADRERARFAAWYEMFPRSQGSVPGQSATFDDCIARLPEIRAMGFDVVYLPPIHPIGRTNRKGRNNALVAGPDDPGCPYAIGNEHGGHTAVDPHLGTLADFRRFVAAAHALGMEVALDFAAQCSPDHPYVREHPEWFYHRPDGTIKFAENPPKKYEDIYPLDFTCEAWRTLWEEMKRIILFWIAQGVKIFRVDNPHTKPVAFWRWLIEEVQRDHPDTIFLSEAFTRPKMMKLLAKAGFTQSYTYFTWRNFKSELIDYFTELTQSEVKEYLRGNLFTNTPDILPSILQQGGRPAFKMRVVLAATLSSVYGIYNGYELCENTAIPGREEYLNSEKYEYKVWDWDRPGNIKDYIARLNQIRQAHPALHLYDNLRFYQADDDNILFYGKATPDKRDVILIAVNLDPFAAHESRIVVPLAEVGIGPGEKYVAHELFTDTRHLWQGAEQHVRLDPHVEPAAIFHLQRWPSKDYDTPCF
jgi:starch synthase (maltosyl-transferring)